jgi:hypothetical protein
MKTSELTGAALDWAVASIELTGHDDYTNVLMVTVGDDNDWKYTPSTDWAQGGAIIERERLSLTPRDGYWDCYVHDRLFEDDGSDHYSTGATPLIAAMRCYVASKLGDEVEIPEKTTELNGG